MPKLDPLKYTGKPAPYIPPYRWPQVQKLMKANYEWITEILNRNKDAD